jgi:hypothetical protein
MVMLYAEGVKNLLAVELGREAERKVERRAEEVLRWGKKAMAGL